MSLTIVDRHEPHSRFSPFEKKRRFSSRRSALGNLRQHLFRLQSLAPVVQRIIDPLKYSEGIFQWVYDLTNYSELSSG